MLSSASIAEQVNSHATFLRRIMASLAAAGIVEAKEGRDGGYTLRQPPERIQLADVYAAMKTECANTDTLDMDCGEVGKQLDIAIDQIMQQAEQCMIEYLRQYSIADVMNSIELFVTEPHSEV